MKSAVALAIAASTASAAITTIPTTNNECWFNEGGQWLGRCTDLFYWYCDKYEVNEDDACNVSIFSDGILDWDFDGLKAAYTPMGRLAKWQVSQNSDDSSTSFSGFLRDFNDIGSQFMNLLSAADENHDRTGDWVDPFADECFELTEYPITYDITQRPKLDAISGMCGFRIIFFNELDTAPLQFYVKRDGASTLLTSALAIAAVSAASLF